MLRGPRFRRQAWCERLGATYRRRVLNLFASHGRGSTIRTAASIRPVAISVCVWHNAVMWCVLRLLPILAFVGLINFGCSPMRYSQYTGKTEFCETSSGTMAEASYRIPVYRGWPEREYTVLGSIRLEDPNARWDNGDFARVASEGKRRGGDAVVIRQGSESGVNFIAAAQNEDTIFYSNQTAALVIRWLTDEELRQRREVVARLISELRQSSKPQYQDLQESADLVQIVVRFLVQSKFGRYTPEMQSDFNRIIAEVTSSNGSSLSGKWMFKAVVSSSGVTASELSNSILGIATVRMDGDSVIVVSETGSHLKTEINFNGQYEKGRLTGQIGLGSLSAKAEGAALADKISLSFQSLTTGGVVRGNLVLQRLVR